ncbi:hypothetical protein [Vibrio parahaemolyticus]|uniref:hypothetical protein n=1 Tax=Vibrio parahaemolyticus TaxID=670 RepID=UPI0004D8B1A4|nr:hypothetical protein [Vibrio parahaemolyticus]OQT82934.1 hypothetical protein EM98_000135 [Vibrio parahaemolyticus]
MRNQHVKAVAFLFIICALGYAFLAADFFFSVVSEPLTNASFADTVFYRIKYLDMYFYKDLGAYILVSCAFAIASTTIHKFEIKEK